MKVTEVHTEDQTTIGGPGGWVAAQIREGANDVRAALDLVRADWDRKPMVGPHPREAALAAAREAVLHLNEALTVEAPEDAIADTRHALEALAATIDELEKLPNKAIVPGQTLPVGKFENAITLLVRAEERLHLGQGYGHPEDNPGIVPPWLQVFDPTEPVVPVDPDTPHIMA